MNDSHTDASTRRTRVELDGSEGEGGGQILRNAISYANILGIDLHIFHIRAGREKPGLRAQHLASVRLPTELCGGILTGDVLSSTELSFTPHRMTTTVTESSTNADTSDSLAIQSDIGTAGSICLLLQAALPCALLARRYPCTMTLIGGTNAAMAPQYDYWEQVFWPTLRDCCHLPQDLVAARVDCRGYYPRGGGQVTVHVQPCTTPLRPIDLQERGSVSCIRIRAFHAGKLPRKAAQDMTMAAETLIRTEYPPVSMQVDVVQEPVVRGSGLGILIVAETTTGCRLAGSAICAPKQRAKDAGMVAANELLTTLQEGGCVDEWLQDQLILYMALARGTSKMITGSLTLHTQTAIQVAERMCNATFRVERLSNDKDTTGEEATSEYGREGRIAGRHLIQCQGIGFDRSSVSIYADKTGYLDACYH
jgi:RNA 3'-terminal phosphate cyclase (ATP)